MLQSAQLLRYDINMKIALYKILSIGLLTVAVLSAPSFFSAHAEGMPAIMPQIVISSDGATPREDDYYAWHPEEDPVFDSDGQQQQTVHGDGYDSPVLLGASDYSYARILLSTRGSTLDITLNGNYSLCDASNIARAFPDYGSVYRLTASGNAVSVSSQGAYIAGGARFTIKEHTPISGTSGNSFSLYNSKYGTLSYRGDLMIYAQNGTLYCVNRVYIEEYAQGVVGGEIGDNSPMEALKAQAVAARSYAVNEISASNNYDMLDTSASQVYKGVCAYDTNSAAAVKATEKQVLFKGSSVIPGLYSSSNGGEKDTSRNRWGGDPAWNGEAVAADTHDLIYSINYAAQNASRSYYEEAVFPANGTKTAANNSLITNSLLPLLVARGYCTSSATAANVTLSSISMSYTPAPNTDSVTYLSYLNVRYVGNVNGTPFDVTDSIYYTKFYVDQGWGLFSNGNLNQYWLGIDASGTNYVLRHARRGHAVGLSQIGARQRALNGENYTSILGFYYDGAYPAASALIGNKTLTTRGFAPPKGDVSNNGPVDVNDVIILCRYIAGTVSLNSTQLSNADVNLDGRVSIADAILICRFIAGLI